MIVNASVITADELFGLVTRMDQRCVPKVVSTLVLTVITIVVGLTTCVVTTCGAVPCPPSKVTTAPLTKPEPVMATFTFVLAGAVFGTMLRIAGSGVAVMAMVGEGGIAVAVGGGRVGMGIVGVGIGIVVGEGGAGVIVGRGVAVITVTAGVIGVNVVVGEDVSVAIVGEGMGEAVGVTTSGAPNSLQPRSGAAPTNPVSGLVGTGSPLTVIYCATPRSIAGEVP